MTTIFVPKDIDFKHPIIYVFTDNDSMNDVIHAARDFPRSRVFDARPSGLFMTKTRFRDSVTGEFHTLDSKTDNNTIEVELQYNQNTETYVQELQQKLSNELGDDPPIIHE